MITIICRSMRTRRILRLPSRVLGLFSHHHPLERRMCRAYLLRLGVAWLGSSQAGSVQAAIRIVLVWPCVVRRVRCRRRVHRFPIKSWPFRWVSVVRRWRLPQSCLCVRMAQVVGAQVMEVGAVRRIGHSVRIEHSAAVAAGTEAALRRWRNGRAVDVKAGILLLPLGATILEPYFYLSE